MKKTKLAGIVLWLLGICLYFYPDVATDLQEIKVQAFVKTYEREHKSRRRSVTGRIRIYSDPENECDAATL